MTPKKVAIYTRVSSTSDQSTKMQEHELRAYAKRRGWDIYKIYSDEGISGATDRRPALDEMLAACRAGRIDVVAVWKFDRIFRSLTRLLQILEFFKDHQIDFFSATENIDTSQAAGYLVYSVLGAVAAFERSLIGERVRAGLQHARSLGKRLGRPPRRILSRKEIAEMRKERLQRNTPFRTLAKEHGVSLWMAHRLVVRPRGPRR
jgi:DNA invertase Pin-like site-specific DNA recombinase